MKESLLPFWPVIKFTESPKSISRLLWHIKFSSRILEMIPAWFDFGLPKTLGFAIDSTCNNLLLMITLVSRRWESLHIEHVTENESRAEQRRENTGIEDKCIEYWVQQLSLGRVKLPPSTLYLKSCVAVFPRISKFQQSFTLMARLV